MILGLKEIKRDNVDDAFGIVIAIKLGEKVDDSFAGVGHAATVRYHGKWVTCGHIGDETTLAETIETGSGVNDDAAWNKNTLGLGMGQLHSWSGKLKELRGFVRHDKWTCCCVVTLFRTSSTGYVCTDIVWRIS